MSEPSKKCRAFTKTIYLWISERVGSIINARTVDGESTKKQFPAIHLWVEMGANPSHKQYEYGYQKKNCLILHPGVL